MCRFISYLTFLRLCRNGGSEFERLAIVADVRGSGTDHDVAEIFNRFAGDLPSDVEVLFLEADTQELVRGYQVSRRNHPLLDQANTLVGAIEMERGILKELRTRADYIIDTTSLAVKDLKKLILNMLALEKENAEVGVKVSSFGVKYGMPISADFVFDVRFLTKPYYKADLPRLTGQD